jgi:polysaccharide biosynthesis transport protein
MNSMQTQLVRRNPNLPGERQNVLPPMESTSDGSMLPDLGRILQILWYRRWAIVLVFFVVFVGVVAGTFLQEPVYRATGVIEIRRDSADAVPPETLFNLLPISNEYLATECGILTSTTLAERVIKELNLAQSEELQSPLWRQWINRLTNADPPTLEALAEKFETLLLVTPVPGSWLVRVNYDAFDANRSAQVVNSVLSNYMRLRMEKGDNASSWLSAQLNIAEAKLKDSENRLQQYTQSNGLQLLETQKGDAENLVNDRLRQLQEALTQAEAERYRQESQVSQLRNKEGEQTLESLDNPVIESLTVRLAEQQREYARLMSSFLPEYPKAREVRNQIDELETQLRNERERHGTKMTGDYQAAVHREKLLREALAGQQQLAYRMARKAGGYNALKREVDNNQQLYTVLQQKIKEVGVSTALKATNAAIVDKAQAPAKPDRPKPVLNLALGGMLGIMLGIGMAFVRDNLDTKLKTAEDVGAILGLPALGLIPSAVLRKRSDRREIPQQHFRSLASPMECHRIDLDAGEPSVLANAFAALRTSVLYGGDTAPRSLLVTSSQPGEGKTTVSVNLALSLARLGRRVLLVDGDTRRPCIHRIFGLSNNMGLTNYLSGDDQWQRYVRELGAAGISILPAGPATPESTELLSSPRLHSLMAGALQTYDFVVVDSPALFINLADARILSGAVDGSVFVVRSGYTPRDMAMRALEQANKVIGVVLNDLHPKSLPGYYHRYYAPDKEEAGTKASATPLQI